MACSHARKWKRYTSAVQLAEQEDIYTSMVLRPQVVMASLREALGARLTGLGSQSDSFPPPPPPPPPRTHGGDSKPESMEDSEPLELRPRARGSSMGEVYVQGLCVCVIAMAMSALINLSRERRHARFADS